MKNLFIKPYHFCYLLLLTFSFFSLHAQQLQTNESKNNFPLIDFYNLSGKITDAKTGTALPGAAIFIYDIIIFNIVRKD